MRSRRVFLTVFERLMLPLETLYLFALLSGDLDVLAQPVGQRSAGPDQLGTVAAGDRFSIDQFSYGGQHGTVLTLQQSPPYSSPTTVMYDLE